MAFTNSSLVSYTRLSPNYNKRTESKITKITIHHMAGNMTVEQCGASFAKVSRQGSSNYGIGTDGRIALYVEEKNRAWTSGSSWNDQRAVTIEVANTTEGAKIGNKNPNADGAWAISDKAYASLIKLCVDICKRNSIKSVNFTGDKNGVMTWHCMYQATQCPGHYIKSIFGQIVSDINKGLGSTPAPTPQPTPTPTPAPTPSDDESKITLGKYYYVSPFDNKKFDCGYVFNPIYYANHQPDVKAAVGTNDKKLFEHFTKYGMNEHRQAITSFDPVKYRKNYPDLDKAYGNNWEAYYEHYCRNGYKEGRKGI